MSMRFLLLALVPIMLLAAACSGDDDELVKNADGLFVVERLDLEGGSYEIGYQDRIVPALESPYPALVARVNGESITGEMLTLKQAELAVQLRQYPEIAEQSGMPDEFLALVEPAFENADPLELLIDDVLLQQAAVRLGYVPSYEEVVERARDFDAAAEAAEATLAQSSPELLVLAEDRRVRLGYPEGDTASDPIRVAGFQDNLAIRNLEKAECDERDPTGGIEDFDPLHTGRDCLAFLASERAAADIEVYVRWVD